MSYGAFVHHSIEDRKRSARQETERQRAEAERRAKAWRAAFDQFPDLRVGTDAAPNERCHPCPWLVWAILNVSAKGPVKRGRVLAERRRLMGKTTSEEAA